MGAQKRDVPDLPRVKKPSAPREDPSAQTTDSSAPLRASLRVKRARAAVSTPGDLTVADDARVAESLDAGGNVHVGRNAVVSGDIFAQCDVNLDGGARIEGLLDVAGSLRARRGSAVGSLELHGRLVTEDGLTRATRVKSRQGLHVSGPAAETPRPKEGA